MILAIIIYLYAGTCLAYTTKKQIEEEDSRHFWKQHVKHKYPWSLSLTKAAFMTIVILFWVVLPVFWYIGEDY